MQSSCVHFCDKMTNNDHNINFAKVLLWPQCFAALTATIGGLIWGTCIGKLY